MKITFTPTERVHIFVAVTDIIYAIEESNEEIELKERDIKDLKELKGKVNVWQSQASGYSENSEIDLSDRELSLILLCLNWVTREHKDEYLRQIYPKWVEAKDRIKTYINVMRHTDTEQQKELGEI